MPFPLPSGVCTTQFPASSVTYEWSYDSSTNTVFQKIRYNGYVYPKD